MKGLYRFIIDVFKGGILFLLPFTLLIIIFAKISGFMLKISEPLSKRLPDIFFGLDGSRVLAILLIIFICFLGGLAFRARPVRKLIGKLEENVLSHIPGYAMFKSLAADTVGAENEQEFKTVVVQDGDGWELGFLIEEESGYCAVFFPEAPKADSGAVKILPSNLVKEIPATTTEGNFSLKNFGKGAIKWVTEHGESGHRVSEHSKSEEVKTEHGESEPPMEKL